MDPTQFQNLQNMFSQLSPDAKAKLKQQLQSRLSELSKPEPEKTPGVLGKVSRFLGVDKFARGIGKAAFGLTKEKKDLDKLLEEGKVSPEEYENITTGGLSNREVVGSAISTGALFAPGAGAKAGLKTKVAVGAATGYAFDIGSKLQDKAKSIEESLTPGIGTAVGAALPILGKITGLSAPGKNAQKAATKLEEINLRLTPVQKQNLARKGKDVSEYLAQKKIVGTPEVRYSKVNDLYNQMEKKVTGIIEGSGKNFDKKSLIDEIKRIPELYADDVAEYPLVSKRVDSVVKTLTEKFPDQIPASRLNSVKRKLYSAAYSKNNTDVVNDALHSIGDVLKSNLDQNIPGLQRLNGEYAKIITAKNLLFKAQSRSQVGILGKAISSAVGGGAGAAVGGFTGAAAGTIIGPAVGQAVAGTATRSALGAGLQTAANAINKIPTDKLGNLQITKKALIKLLQQYGGTN